MNLDIERFLEDTSGRYAVRFAAVIQDLLAAEVAKDRTAARRAEAELEDILRTTMGMAEILGARLMLQQAAKVMAREQMAADRGRLVAFADQPLVPAITFEEALEDLVTRTPVTIRNSAERTAQRISELYSEGRNLAFVRATTDTVTQTARDYLQKAFQSGLSAGDAAKGLADAVAAVRENTVAWSRAYASTVFRTNVNTAVTAGRFRQAQDPDIRAVIPAFRFDAVGDADSRDNHDAADGIILRTDNPEWRRIAPPLGYNCRCQVTLMSVPELRRMGRIGPDGQVIESRVPSNAFPDPGFRHGGRPDLFINETTR